MAEQNNTSANTSTEHLPKGGLSAESGIPRKVLPILARVASVTAVLMYVFYFPQIIGNPERSQVATGFSLWSRLSTAPCGFCTVCGAPRRTSRSSSRTLPGIVFGNPVVITAPI